MATLTVWKFGTTDGAENAVDTLRALERDQLVTVHDAATVTWPVDKKRPKTRHLADMTGPGALGGAFWGLLFGILFFVPLIGLAVGAAVGVVTGSLAHVGIQDDFIGKVRAQVTPGTSALFVLSSEAVLDRVHEAFAGQHAELISTNLSEQDEVALREVFADA